jgi:hypothetical protein
VFSSSDAIFGGGASGAGGGGGGGGSSSPGMAGAAAMLESFPFSQGIWEQDSAGDLWAGAPPLSFVTYFPTNLFTKLYWFEQFFTQNAGHQTGNMSIWGISASAPVNIFEGGILDGSGIPERHTFPLPLDISPYQALALVSDGALGSGVSGYNLVSQSKSAPNSPGFAGGIWAVSDYGFLGVHLGGANTPYSAIPIIPAESPQYYMSLWARLGVF